MTLFRIVSQQSEVQSLDRRSSFNRELFADPLLLFKALDLVTTRTTILLDQRSALGLSNSDRP